MYYLFAPDRLLHYRALRGLTREALAVAADVSHSAVVAYELGHRRPNRAILLRLAVALSISPRDLVVDDPMFAEAVE